MPDILEQGLAWLDDQRHAHMARTVTYVRGINSVEVLATIGRTEFEQADDFGIVHKIQSRDFLIRADDLLIGGEPIAGPLLPRAGDRIRETIGSQTFVYEVLAPGNEPPWRYSDPYRKTLRIHTKHVETEA